MLNRRVLISDEISPINVTLLILIKLYVCRQLPKTRKILYLLIQQLEEGKPNRQNELDITPDLSDLCIALGVSHSKSDGASDLNLEDSSMNVIIFMLLDFVWGIQSEEQLHGQINDAYTLILNPNVITYEDKLSVSPRSIVGRFLQKIVVASKLLHFDESILLYQTFCLFRESSRSIYDKLLLKGFQLQFQGIENTEVVSAPLYRTWHHKEKDAFRETGRKGPDDDAEVFKKLQDQLNRCLSTSNGRGNEFSATSVTKSDLEHLINAQVSLLEKYGTPTPPEVRTVLEQMATTLLSSSNVHRSDRPPFPSYYYLQYLENLYEGNYLKAFDSLHQYFDYMVSQGSKYFYHFALIARASLHQCFGEDQKALDSIEEAISVARENKDNGTLTYILSWLFNFMKNKPHLWTDQQSFQDNSELQLLEFFTRKSQNVSLLLAAVSFCYTTESLLSAGECPSRVTESLFRAVYVSVNDGPASFVKCCRLASLVWERFGVPHLSDLYADIGTSFASIHGCKSDYLFLKARHGLTLFSRGEPQPAIDELEALLETNTGDFSQRQCLQNQILALQIQKCLRSGKILMANKTLAFLLGSGIGDEETQFQVLLLRTRVLIANDDLLGAINLINREISDSKSWIRLNLYYSMRLNLEKTFLLIRHGVGTRALSLLFQQIKLGRAFGFGLVLTEALAQLVSLLNNTSHFSEAYQIALSLVPAAIKTQDQHLIASIHYELARCCSSFLEGESENMPSVSKDMFAYFLEYLSISIAGFKKTLDLEMLTECFKLEDKVALAETTFTSEISDSAPFRNFIKHSRAGIEILRKKAKDASDHGYLKI